jgi:hypothetical protein
LRPEQGHFTEEIICVEHCEQHGLAAHFFTTSLPD